MIRNLQLAVDKARARALDSCSGYARWAPQIAGTPEMLSLYINTTIAEVILAISAQELHELVDDWRRQAEARKAKVA